MEATLCKCSALMDIGLVNVDSLIPPLQLAKIATYHKEKGDAVKLFDPLTGNPDVIYAAKIFQFTPDYPYFPESAVVIKGGTGYNIAGKLPSNIESLCPDYDIFDYGVYKRDKTKLGEYAMGFCSRGCIRNCPFCIVRQKEGDVRAVGDIYDFWRGQKFIKLFDNNLTALPEHFELIVNQLIKEELKVDFNQGLDIRLIDNHMAQLLAKIRIWKRIHFAFDHVSLEQAVRRGIDVLVANGVKKYKLMFYVLIGFDSSPEEDMYRVELLRSLGVDSFVMPYNKTDTYQKRFARWVNRKAIFKSVSWNNYAR